MDSVQKLKELLDQKAQIDAQIQEATGRLKSEGLSKVKELVDLYGLSKEDVFGFFPSAQKATSQRKSTSNWYYNPANPEQIYRGKGRSPDWFKAIPANQRKNYIVQR
ncbi:MAG: H-NS histone family protein [Rhodocyclaceae bacterium]|jgi:DNA-binding protein H-NS